jgi:hypothetical protein
VCVFQEELGTLIGKSRVCACCSGNLTCHTECGGFVSAVGVFPVKKISMLDAGGLTSSYSVCL